MKNTRTHEVTGGQVRPPAVAGMFYPADPGELSGTIVSMIGPDATGGDAGVRGIIAPHAGYAYSGPTAAKAYTMLRAGAYDTVVIIAPSHREHFEGVSAYEGEAYLTPLGSVPVDAPLREALLRQLGHHQRKALSLGPQHVLARHAQIVEEQFRGVLRLHPELLEIAPA